MVKFVAYMWWHKYSDIHFQKASKYLKNYKALIQRLRKDNCCRRLVIGENVLKDWRKNIFKWKKYKWIFFPGNCPQEWVRNRSCPFWVHIIKYPGTKTCFETSKQNTDTYENTYNFLHFFKEIWLNKVGVKGRAYKLQSWTKALEHFKISTILSTYTY